MTGITWQNAGTYLYSDELSDDLRLSLQPQTKFRQFCNADEGAISKGLHRGQQYSWNVYSNLATQGRKIAESQVIPETSATVTQNSLTVDEFGNSVPISGKVQALAKHDVKRIVTKQLSDDARKAFDIEAWAQFNATKLRVAPSGGNSPDAVTLTENGSTATTNNSPMLLGHIKAISDLMRERNIPGYGGADDYYSIGHVSTYRPFKNELESIHQYTQQGLGMIMSGEAGRYESIRFVEQNFIPKGGAADSTTFSPYTNTADPWNNGKSGWAFFFGDDTVNEAVVIPEEIRGKIATDYGRGAGIAWYAITGFGLWHLAASESRIVKWDSAA